VSDNKQSCSGAITHRFFWGAVRLGFFLLWVSISVFSLILLLAIIFSALDFPIGIEPVTFGRAVTAIYLHAFVPVMTVLSDILKSMFPWPALVLVAAFLIFSKPNVLASILSAIESFEVAGFKIKSRTWPENFRKEFGDARRSVFKANKEINEAYGGAKDFARQLDNKYKISDLMGKMSQQIATKIITNCPDSFRFTLYIPDLVFVDRLFQFTEYFTKDGQTASDGKMGRAYSVRYGIIGRVWRSGVSEVEGELITNQEKEEMIALGQSPKDKQDLERFIARRWGLTLEEAVSVRLYPSYGAFRLTRAQKDVGLIFFYAKEENAFNQREKDKVTKDIAAFVQESELVEKLLELHSEVPWSERIEVYKNS
jgi:hypothetical protein